MAKGNPEAGHARRADVVPKLGTLAVHADMGGRRGIGVGAFMLALVTAGAMAHVGVRMKGIEVAYDLGRERRVNTQLEEERRRLNIEIGMLKDPVRIVSMARDKLKMGPPAQADIVRLAPGQILGARPVSAPVKKAEPASKPRAHDAAPKVAARPAAARVAAEPSASAEAAPAEAPERESEPAQEGDE